ncbi:uncharacterized protein LOC128554939 [Mercenaria mercenaria]|uniref:uncharacterized protein LOC128554939 n=1 Tax=Mercenaria mercenaria TaxID=6596 RepID=UPI00234F1ED1|nr:uncharacterized protein LOC128554939 [Mercenaria mercenaria]
METSRMGIVGAFNTLWGNDKLTTILRLPQEGTVQDQYISRIGIPGSVQNFVTSRNLFPTTRNNILPAERGDIVDNYVGSTDTGTMMEPSREGISEAFNMSYRNETEKTILRLPQPDRAPDQSISHIRMPASLQNFTTRYRRHILPEQILSTERGVVTDHLSSTHGHQRIQRVAHNQTSIPSAQRLTGSHVWSVKEKHKCNIRVNGDVIKCDIRGCCRLTSGEILLADHVHSRLKKLNDRYQVISVCKMPPFPNDVCYIGNNVAVVSLTSNKLQFIDIREGMTLTRSVDTDHSCWGLAYGNNQLYVVGDSFVCIYSKDGIKQHILYTHQSRYPLFRNIALSDDGCLIYISNMYGELVTVDSSGNHMCPFTDTELREASGVCVDGEGHVLVSCYLDKILQLSFDGKMKLGIIANRSDNRYSAKTLCFDKENTILVAAGCNDNIWVLKLQL